MSNDIAEQIEADIRKLEEHSVNTSTIRKSVVDKLSVVVDTMKIDPDTDKSTALEAKMGVINTLLKALSDSDNQKIDLIKMKQKVRAEDVKEDSAKQISATVSAYLRQISTKVDSVLKSQETDQVDVEEQLGEVLLDPEIPPILDSELEFTTKTAQDIQK